MTDPRTDPFADPFNVPVSHEMTEGLTVGQIIAATLPGASDADLAQLRVVLGNAERSALVPRRLWPCVRPKPGHRVVLRLVPEGDNLRSVLLAVVSVAALSFAGPLAGVFGITSRLGVSLVGLGLNLAGSLLVNALIPPPQTPEAERTRNTYTLSGWSNTVRPDAPVPLVLGRHRMAPPFAATSYSEIVGDQQYVRALFCFGYGRLEISDLRLGDTPLDKYDAVETEIREGVAGDASVTLYPRQVLEEALGSELVRPLPRDAAGEIIDGAAIETPVVRLTATDSQSVTVILGFPAGLFRIKTNGEERENGVSVRIRQRLPGGDWSEVETLVFVAKKRAAFFRQHSWQLPSRGRWEIEITRMTAEQTETTRSDRVILSAIQSIRPEYPINLDTPLALVALRIRATYQLNGQLDDFNAVVQRYAPVWDGTTWADGLGRNPASAFLVALQGPANPYPATDAQIDWDLLQDWHAFCATKSLTYDRPHEEAKTLGDMLGAIAAAGRATPRHDGTRWGVVIDRPQDLVVDHINHRNSRDFAWQRGYPTLPHAFRIQFRDETNGWDYAERIVPFPDHTGSVTLTEELSLPGLTHPDQIWIAARRRQYEILHRPDTFTCLQDGAARTATRGDLVMGSFQVLDRTQVSARVREVTGRLVALDETVTMAAGTTCGLRFRVFANETDSIGTSRVVAVAPTTGSTALLRLPGSGAMPAVGDAVHFGVLGTESLALRILGIEPAEDFANRLTLIADAPQIDTLTDAEVPPAWDGRVGSAIVLDALAPATPTFLSIVSDAAWAAPVKDGGDPDVVETPVTVLLSPGQANAALLSTYRVEHRLIGAGSWDAVTFPTALGGTGIDGYATGDTVEIRAFAVAADDTDSLPTPTATHLVGGRSVGLPGALEDSAITVTGGLGLAVIVVAIPAASLGDSLSVYRTPQGADPDLETDLVISRITLIPGVTLTLADGDATRETLIENGGFDDGLAWDVGGGWAIGAGRAGHTAGSASFLDQNIAMTAGAPYRWSFKVSDRTASSVYLRAVGDTNVNAAAVTANGLAFGVLTAPENVTRIAIVANGAFDGAIDDVTIYLETAACAPAGVWDYYIAPRNRDNFSGALAGPYTTEIK